MHPLLRRMRPAEWDTVQCPQTPTSPRGANDGLGHCRRLQEFVLDPAAANERQHDDLAPRDLVPKVGQVGDNPPSADLLQSTHLCGRLEAVNRERRIRASLSYSRPHPAAEPLQRLHVRPKVEPPP